MHDFTNDILPHVATAMNLDVDYGRRRNAGRKALQLTIENMYESAINRGHHGAWLNSLASAFNAGLWSNHIELPQPTISGLVSMVARPETCVIWSVAWEMSLQDGHGLEPAGVVDSLFDAMTDHNLAIDGRSGKKVFLTNKLFDSEHLEKVTAYMENTLGIDPNLKSEPNDEAPKMTDGIKTALESLLSTAGLPAIEEIVRLKGLLDDAQEAGSILSTECAELRIKLDNALLQAAEASRVVSTDVQSSGEIPSGTVTLKKAYELFDVPSNAREAFDIDVPHGEWDAPHPYVPDMDKAYVFDMDTLVPMLVAISRGTIPWLKGHTGTGKTTLVEQIYAHLNLPVYRVNLDSDITRGELVGREVLTVGEGGQTVTKFVDGIIPSAMQQPCALLLDEIDASRADLGFVLQRLTEGKGFMLLEDGGRTIKPHPFFRMFATANTNGRGDESGLYTGTRALGAAFINRFKPYLEIDYMSRDEEAELLQERVPIDAESANMIANYAVEHREAFKQANITLPCSPRDTIALAHTFVTYRGLFTQKTLAEVWSMSFEHTLVNAADSDDAQVVAGLLSRIIVGDQ